MYKVLSVKTTKNTNFYILESSNGKRRQGVSGKELLLLKNSFYDLIGNFVNSNTTSSLLKLDERKVEMQIKSAQLIRKGLNDDIEGFHKSIKRQAQTFKSDVLKYTNKYAIKQGFQNVVTPKLLSTKSEGGSEVFTVDVFGNEHYLAQSPQLYKQAYASTIFPKVYEIGNVYRAEKSNTSQHLYEFTSIDFEEVVSDNITEGFNHLINSAKSYLTNLFQCVVKKTPIFKQISLRDDLKIGDLTKEMERKLYAESGVDFLIVTHYDNSVRAFYTEGEYSFDVLYKGVEIISGSVRKVNYEDYIAELEKRGMSTVGLEDYLNMFKHGVWRTGGFAMGLERFVAAALDLESVKLLKI